MDNPAKVCYISAIIPELLDIFTNLKDELFAQIIVHNDIVWRDACLAGIHKSPESDFLSCEINFRALIDNYWTLSTQLKDTRDEILSCCLSYKFSLLSAPSEAYAIKFPKRYSFCNFNFPFYADVASCI